LVEKQSILRLTELQGRVQVNFTEDSGLVADGGLIKEQTVSVADGFNGKGLACFVDEFIAWIEPHSDQRRISSGILATRIRRSKDARHLSEIDFGDFSKA
jgi:hypothetical protein